MKKFTLIDYTNDTVDSVVTDENTFDVNQWVQKKLDHGEFFATKIFDNTEEYLVFFAETNILYGRVIVSPVVVKYVLKDTYGRAYFTRQYNGGFLELDQKYAHRIDDKNKAQDIANRFNELYNITDRFIIEEVQ